MKIIRVILTTAVFSLSTASIQAANYTLRMGGGHTTGLTYVNVFDTYFATEVVKRVKDATGDNVRFIKAWGGSVAKVDATIEAVQKGTLDIGLVPIGFEQSRAALLNYSAYVPFTTPDPVLQQQISHRMMREVPALQQSMRAYNSHVLAAMTSEAYGLATTFDWNTMDGLKGKRLGVASSNAPLFFPVQAVPVSLGIGEHYQALQTKLLEGSLFYMSGMQAFKLKEVAQFWNKTGFGSLSTLVAFMNVDVRAKLPAPIVQIIDEVAREAADRVAEISKQRDQDVEASLRAEGITINTLPEAERKRWAQLLMDMPGKAARELDAKGMPATQVLKTYIRFLNEAGYQFPVDYPL